LALRIREALLGDYGLNGDSVSAVSFMLMST